MQLNNDKTNLVGGFGKSLNDLCIESTKSRVTLTSFSERNLSSDTKNIVATFWVRWLAQLEADKMKTGTMLPR